MPTPDFMTYSQFDEWAFARKQECMEKFVRRFQIDDERPVACPTFDDGMTERLCLWAESLDWLTRMLAAIEN